MPGRVPLAGRGSAGLPVLPKRATCAVTQVAGLSYGVAIYFAFSSSACQRSSFSMSSASISALRAWSARSASAPWR